MRDKRNTIYLLFALAVLASCYRQPVPDGKRSIEQFMSSVKTFPYTASGERHLHLISNYGKISTGMSKEQIASVLGDPDYSDVIEHKAFGGMKPHGSLWIYGLYCTSKYCGTSGEDKLIEILFDLDGMARWIVPRNIEWLVEKGGPWRS